MCFRRDFECHRTVCNPSTKGTPGQHESPLQVLATSDLILGITWSLWDYFWFSPDKSYCSIASLLFPYAYQVSIWFTMISLSGISINLYLLITRPLRYYSIVTRRRFFMTLTSALVTTLLVCGIYLPIPESPFIQLLINRCLRRDTSAQLEWASILHTLYLVVPVCATLTFTTPIYIRLLAIARQKFNAIGNVEIPRAVNQIDDDFLKDRGQPPTYPQMVVVRDLVRRQVRQRNRRFHTFKGFWTILLLTGSFSMVWIPFVVSYIFIPTDPFTVAVLDMMAISNTLVQPIVYLITNSKAKRYILKNSSLLFGQVRELIGMAGLPRMLCLANHE